jgi:predicted nucleic-acid-binding protein
MIGLDTNVLVRYLVQDDPEQSLLATAFIESDCTAESPGFICNIVLVELVWVLDQGYGYAKEYVVAVLSQLLSTSELKLENPDLVFKAIQLYRNTNVGFADCLLSVINHQQGCSSTATFDKKAAKLSEFKLLTQKANLKSDG